MEIRRIIDPKIIELLKPLFTEDGAFTREIIAKELLEIMTVTPDEIFIVVILDGKILNGFGIAWIPDDREYVWLAQAWSQIGCKKDYGRAAIEEIKQWAVDKYNLHEMRFETNRNPRVIKRAWGFKIYAHVMGCNF